MHLLKSKFNSDRPVHVSRLHKALSVFDNQALKNSGEKKNREFGPVTSMTLKKVKRSLNLPNTDRLDKQSIEKINQAIIDKTLESKSQVRKIQKKIKRAARIAKIRTDISTDMKNVKIASETKTAVKLLKTKYKLKKSSKIDVSFLEILDSINASRPKPLVKLITKPTQLLNKVRHPLRLNKKGSRVNDLQDALAWLEYSIDKKEYDQKKYGKSTRNAVIAFQKKYNLPVTGNVGWRTKTKFNEMIKSNRRMVPCQDKYRVRGTVRDENWQPVPYAKIQIFEKQFKKDALLVERKTLSNGFYDVQYLPPIDPVTGRPKQKFQLEIKWVNTDNKTILEKSFHVFSKVLWANFTRGDQPYKGPSFFTHIETSMKKKIDNVPVFDLEESDQAKDVSYIRRDTSLAAEDIMKMILSHHCARLADDPMLDARVFYAFIHQSMPDTLPAKLFPGKPEEWGSWIEETVSAIIEGVAMMDPAIAEDVLKNALKQNYIPRACQMHMDDILKSLNDLTITWVLEKPIMPGQTSFKALLDTDRINKAKYRQIAVHLNKNKQFNDTFWNDIENDPALTDLDIRRIKKITQLGHIAHNHIETMSFLRKQLNRRNREGLRLKSISEFALLSQKNWEKLIADNGNKIPDWVEGDSLAQRKAHYAKMLEQNTSRLFSSISVISRISQITNHALGRVTKILRAVKQVPDYRIETQPVDMLLSQTNIALEDSEISALKAIQRVFRVSQSVDMTCALVESGFYSASQVYHSGQENLTSILTTKGFSKAEASKVYNNCECLYATTIKMMVEYRDQLQLNLNCIPSYKLNKTDVDDLKGQIPDIESLFGPLESREVRHCESVLGPSAYLVDLFRFLGKKQSKVFGKFVKDILFDRRPDLGNIKLNCMNTKTPMPYIDLVCEILESHVAGNSGNIDFQSTRTAEELRAEPEHIEPQAYYTIKLSDYPIYGSFNLWQEETRAFLNQLGVKRWELMRTFQAQALHIATEYFGISSQERPIITTPRRSSTWQKKYWSDSITDPDISVSFFLNKSALTYVELLCLLNTRFINSSAPKLVITSPSDVVDPDHQSFNNLSNKKLDKINRFLRLLRKTDYTIWELDLLIMGSAFGEQDIDGTFLINLYQFNTLERKLKLKTEELHGFYHDINTRVYYKTDDFSTPGKSLFEKLFLSGTIEENLKANFSALLLSGDTGIDLKTVKEHVMASLSIDSDTFDLLIDKTSQTLSRSSLSIMYRYVMLARALKIKMKDFLTFLDISGISNPFTTIDTTLEIIKSWELVKRTKTDLLTLEYLLNPALDSSKGLRENTYIMKIRTLREAIAGLHSKIKEADQAGEDSLEMLLGMLDPFEEKKVLDTVFLILAGTWPKTQTEITDFIESYFTEFVADIDQTVSTLAYTAPVSETELADRRDYLKNELINYISMTTIKEVVSVAFNIASDHADLLLNKLTLQGEIKSLISTLQTSKLFEKNKKEEYLYDINTSDLKDVFEVMYLIHKASVLINSLKMDMDDLDWFIENHALTQTIDFKRLPIDTLHSSLNFTAWEQLARLLAVKKSFPAPENVSFFDVMDKAALSGVSVSEINQELCSFTGWDLTEHQNLDDSSVDFMNPETWEWLNECYRYRNITGVDFNQLYALARTDQASKEDDKADTVKRMVKSKYDSDKWLKVFEPIMDTLREKKRAALVAWLIENSQRTRLKTITQGSKKISNPEYFRDSNDLFRWFCIDVEMCSEQLTSRIKQAISTCQLFINQCFLNIEPKVSVALPDPDIENSWKQWKWMKNYRIWEANRKVFLYPENWIEPELRHDKSPFFKELEDDILSKELTDETAEEALQRYIQKLDQVANLKVASIFHQKETDINLLHVIAHTHDNPPVYFYRTYNLNYDKWSAWEQIATEIDSAHAVPWIYNRKLHLFWITFLEKPIKIEKLPPFNQSQTDTQDAPNPPKMLEIQLGWTSRTKDGWQAATISKKKLIHPWERPGFSYNIKPEYRSHSNTLHLQLYISTSKAFNEELFYNQYDNKKKKFTQSPFDETFKPWHSSSFVFDGKVKEVWLHGLSGYYFNQTSNSYQFVKTNFPAADHIKEIKINDYSLALPSGMHYHYTRLRNNTTHDRNDTKFNVFSADRETMTLLNKAKSPFEAVLCQQGLGPVNDKIRPLFYQDDSRAFFIKQDQAFRKYELSVNNGAFSFDYILFQFEQYSVYPFYHPWSHLFQKEINKDGIQGFYDRNLQLNPQHFSSKSTLNFKTRYEPNIFMNFDAVKTENIDFSRNGPYSIYNWELFFHVPMLIANRLFQNQRFEEAMTWYHYIFDPTNTQNHDTPERFWITKPFFQTSHETYKKERIQYIIDHIDEFKKQLVEWRNHPFRPHLIASHRTVAYQKAIVMKYIENLIAWGDRLFARDTMESINEALLLYVIASELLGDRPQLIPALNIDSRTFNELEAESQADELANFRVETPIENMLGLPIVFEESSGSGSEEIPHLDPLYFGLPHNDKLLSFWDIVEDRLFKIRHSMNIKGIKRTLALFAPPIDPGLLVKAAAAGIDLASVLDHINSPSQVYRFNPLAEMALEFCKEVSQLGEKLLSALEKKDLEKIELLRASNEVKVLENMKKISKSKIDEADEEYKIIEKQIDSNQTWLDHLKSLEEKIEEEKKADTMGKHVTACEVGEKVCVALAKVVTWIPQFNVGANGAGGTPEATTQTGGQQAAKYFEYGEKGFAIASKGFKYLQEKFEKEGKKKRKAAAKKVDEKIRSYKKDILDIQLTIAEIKQDMAKKEFESLGKKIEMAKGEKEYLETKYTNAQLYQWMVSQISSIYFQAYQLAYDMAKRAEKSYQKEIGVSTSFIEFGYWDSLKKGLLSADKLCFDVRRMQASYLDQNKRELEITKHVSLANLAPDKLMELKLTGQCFLDIDEWMYNLDHPGHYWRRIKTVSMSVKCDADEFTNINCSLMLLSSEIRNTGVPGDQGYDKTEDDSRFTLLTGKGQAIATSHCKYDAGLFKLSFNDERFLPFEGEGAISSWDIRMPQENNMFDFNELSDVIIHVSYTAKEGGETLATPAKASLATQLSGTKTILIGMSYSFPKEWGTFLKPEISGGEQVLQFKLLKSFYPFLDRQKEIQISKIGIVIQGQHTGNYDIAVSLPNQNFTAAIQPDMVYQDIHYKDDIFQGTAPCTGDFSIKIKRDTASSGDFSSLPENDLYEVYFIVDYQ